MDNLARNTMLAKQAGMSYGKWKAMQPLVKKIPVVIPDGWKPCEFCGKPFKRTQGRRFCDIGCRNQAYAEKNKKLKAEYMRTCRRKESTNESCC